MQNVSLARELSLGREGYLRHRGPVNGGEPIDCSFSACGGTIGAGIYKAKGACAKIEQSTDAGNPFSSCQDAVVRVDLGVSGQADLKADQSYSVDFYVSRLTYEFTLPSSCLPQGLSSCDQLAGNDDDGDDHDHDSTGSNTTCVGSSETGCTCSGSQVNDKPAKAETGTWSTADNKVKFVSTGSTPEESDAVDYCVAGSSLKLSIPTKSDGSGGSFVVEFTKQ